MSETFKITDRKKAYMANYRKVNADRIRAQERVHYHKNKDRELANAKAWKARNPDRHKANRRASDARRAPAIRIYQRKWENRKFATDLAFRLHRNVRTLVRSHLKSKNGRQTTTFLGCESNFFRKWIESQFEPGMSMGNRSEWHIDHIFPIACCGGDQALIELAFNYRNLRPMWASQNKDKWHNLTEDSVVAAYLCGISTIHITKPNQATDQVLSMAERIGFKIVRGSNV